MYDQEMVQRWMVKHKKRPYKKEENTGVFFDWSWWDECQGANKLIKSPSHLPHELSTLVGMKHGHNTRKEAEEILINPLKGQQA